MMTEVVSELKNWFAVCTSLLFI